MTPRTRKSHLAEAINLTQGSFLKIMREEKDLPFLAAVKLLDYFQISLADFIGMLSKEELEKPEVSRVKHQRKMARLREEGEQPLRFSPEDLERITGLELMTSVMEVLGRKIEK